MKNKMQNHPENPIKTTVTDQLSQLLASKAPQQKPKGGRSRSTQANPRHTKRNTSIQLRQDDRESINEILDLVCRQTGERGSTTDAIRIALSLCPMNGRTIESCFRSVRLKDGRSKASL